MNNLLKPVKKLQDSEDSSSVNQKWKKVLVYILMGIVFMGCMHLIFFKENTQITEEIGLNISVPNPSEGQLPENKKKAYEQEEQKDSGLNSRYSLSNYWTSEQEKPNVSSESSPQHKAMTSTFKSVQRDIDTFYANDNSEVSKLEQELKELKKQLSEKEDNPENPIEQQLELMERSYQMAAKYFPTSAAVDNQNKASIGSPSQETSTNSAQTSSLPKTAFKACVHQTITLLGEGLVSLRILEDIALPNVQIPQGSLLKATSRLMQNRLTMHISSVEVGGSIFPVNLEIYDLEGQRGLPVSASLESNAARDIAANMSQSAATNIIMTQSAGQQIAADLSRSTIQGVSGYFSRKARTSKVTLKADHQVFIIINK